MVRYLGTFWKERLPACRLKALGFRFGSFMVLGFGFRVLGVWTLRC